MTVAGSPQIPSRYKGPGLFDAQVNGFDRFDFNSPAEEWKSEELHRLRLSMRRRGIVRALPTLITDEPPRMLARARRFRELIEADATLEAVFPRLHIEGPFISSEDGPRGAHSLAFSRAPAQAPDFLERLREASGDRIGIVTLAPELDGALEFIEKAASAGIVAAIGHTAASASTIGAAVRAGARLSTHLGNASHPLLPRLDTYIYAQLAEDDLMASFIADGHHIPYFTLKCFLRAKTPGRSILVSDAIAAAGAGPGRYMLKGEEVIVSRDLRAAKPGQPNLAGSALTLDRGVLNVALHCDASFEEAWRMASTAPAALLGMADPPEIEVDVSSDGFAICE